MNKEKIEEMLLAGLSRFNTDLTANYIGKDQEHFNLLLDLMINGRPPIPQRAAWVVAIVVEKYPWLIKPYISKLIDLLPGFQHWGIQRCLLSVYQKIDIPETKLGEMFDICYKYLNDTKVPIAVRVFAMQILYNISLKEPELQGELKLLIESHFDTGSAGYQSRAKKILKKLS